MGRRKKNTPHPILKKIKRRDAKALRRKGEKILQRPLTTRAIPSFT